MAKLSDDTLEQCARQIADAVQSAVSKEYLSYECAKLCTQAAVYLRAVELVEGIDLGVVDDYTLTSEGPKDGEPTN